MWCHLPADHLLSKEQKGAGPGGGRRLFLGEETALILNVAEAEKLPPERLPKLELAGLSEYLEILPRNLRKLFRKSE